MKLTKRKGFNFFRSYYDVYNELNDADKVAFIDALLDRQFLGVKPINLTGMAKFAYISQTNSIDSQVKGYNDKMRRLGNPLIGDDLPPTYGVQIPPTEQEEEKEEEERSERSGPTCDCDPGALRGLRPAPSRRPRHDVVAARQPPSVTRTDQR